MHSTLIHIILPILQIPFYSTSYFSHLGDLPLHLLHFEKERIQMNSMMTRTFQKVTVARW